MNDVQILSAVCFLTAGMLFFMTMLYIAATPEEDEPRPAGWWKPRPPTSTTYCPLHRCTPDKCRQYHKDQ